MKKDMFVNTHSAGILYRTCLLLALSAGIFNASAQSKTEAYVIGQGGWEAGSASDGFMGEGIVGVRHNRWGWGLASGVDNASVTSVPLLADVRWALVPGRHALEIFSQEGWSFVTQKSSEFDSFSNGPCWYGGLSYQLVSIGAKSGLWISAGAGYKQYKEHTISILPNNDPGILLVPGPWPGDSPTPLTTTHKQWRGILTLGWRW